MSKQALRLVSVPVLTVVLALMAPEVAKADEMSTMFHLIAGRRWLDKGSYPNVQPVNNFAFSATWGKTGQQMLFATDLIYANGKGTDDRTTLQATFWELGLGLRKVWQSKRVVPYFGAGILLMKATLDENSQRQGDRSTGVWVGTGAVVRLDDSRGHRFNIGGDLRYSASRQVLLFGDRNTPSLQLGFVFGWENKPTK